MGAVSYIETSKALYNKGVLNILNENDDYCLLLSVLAHIHKVDWDKHLKRLYYYRKYFNDIKITGLQLQLKNADVPKFERIKPSISVNVLVTITSICS